MIIFDFRSLIVEYGKFENYFRSEDSKLKTPDSFQQRIWSEISKFYENFWNFNVQFSKKHKQRRKRKDLSINAKKKEKRSFNFCVVFVILFIPFLLHLRHIRHPTSFSLCVNYKLIIQRWLCTQQSEEEEHEPVFVNFVVLSCEQVFGANLL